MDQPVIYSSKEALEEFKSSNIWLDIIKEIEFWKESIQEELLELTRRSIDENLSTANVLLRTGDINGRLSALDYVLTIPDVLISSLEDQHARREQTDGSGVN